MLAPKANQLINNRLMADIKLSFYLTAHSIITNFSLCSLFVVCGVFFAEKNILRPSPGCFEK
jgi:hypothetical protein